MLQGGKFFMKKYLVMAMAMLLALGTLAGCGNQQAQDVCFQLFLLPSGECQAVDDVTYRADQVRDRSHIFSWLRDCSTSSQ